MSYATFYDPQIMADASLAEYTLVGEEARHACQVRRVRVGETIDLVNGLGTRLRGTVTAIDKRWLTVEPQQVVQEQTPTQELVLVQALAKGGRDESAIEAATELGVDGIVAWESSRSVSQWKDEKENKGIDRWGSILTSAMKQSRRSFRPRLYGFARGNQLKDLIPAGASVLILHETADTPITQVSLPAAGTICVVVGPEGGLTPEELESLAESHGATPVLLGEEVLRTSTAGPAALAALNVRLGRW